MADATIEGHAPEGSRRAGVPGEPQDRLRQTGVLVTLLGLGLFAAGFLAGPLLAQTGEFGALRVEVRAVPLATPEAPALLAGVTLTLTPDGPGLPLELRTSSTGVVEFTFVPAGRWTLRAERFGFVPVVVEGVEVPRGDRVSLPLLLREATPPVMEVDRVSFRALAPAVAASGATRGTPTWGIRVDPITAALLGPAAGEGTGGPPSLPPRFVRLQADGLPFGGAHAGVQGPGLDRFALFPEGLVEPGAASLLPEHRLAADGAGPFVAALAPLPSATGWRGVARVGGTAHLAGDASGPRGDLGGTFAPDVMAVLSGPLGGGSVAPGASGTPAPATTRLLVGVSGRRLVTPLPVALEATTEGPPPAGRHRYVERDVLSGLARLDTDLSPTLSLAWYLRFAALPERDAPAPSLPSLPGLLLPAQSGADLSTSARLLARSEGGNAFEMRLGVDRSTRTVGTGTGSPAPVGGGILSSGFHFGTPEGGAAETERLSVSFAPTGVFRLGERNQMELGLVLSVRRHDERWAPFPHERVLLPPGPGLDSGSGDPAQTTPGGGFAPAVRRQVEGPAASSENTIPRVGIIVQHRWSPALGTRVHLGLRADFESVPFEEVVENEAWALASGLPRSVPEFRSGRLSPEVALRWRPGGTSPLLVQARGSVSHADLEPWLLAELLREDGRMTVTRTLGRPDAGGGAPGEGGPAVLESRAPRLTLRGPGFERPRTAAAELSLDAGLPGGWTLGGTGFVHRTDFLPRRRDLNRVPGPGITDPFGRIHFGELAVRNGIVGIAPGSDRRFPAFDRVDALETDGWSRTAGLTLSAGWEVPDARLLGTWTWAETTDNAPFDPAGFAAPFDGAPDGTLADPAWREGTADLDIPHRIRILADAALPGLPALRLGGALGIRSGLPFTPGVRDALGEGWTRGWTALEPIAFAPATLPAGLLEAWPCLATASETRRLARNACRGETIRQLDLRGALELPLPAGTRGLLVIEALNLLDEGDRILDAALFRAIPPPGGVLERSSDGSRFTLPTEVNPTFGRPVADLSPGRALRVGLEVRF